MYVYNSVLIYLQSHGLFKRGKGRCINFSVPEVKILILLSFFIAFGIVSLANFSVTFQIFYLSTWWI